jgi:hypothetical protein
MCVPAPPGPAPGVFFPVKRHRGEPVPGVPAPPVSFEPGHTRLQHTVPVLSRLPPVSLYRSRLPPVSFY